MKTLRKTFEVILEVSEGDRLHVVEYYSSYGANEDETSYDLIAKMTTTGLHFFDEKTEKQFYKGANSAYKFTLHKLP
jgi:hypothetical protein